MSNATAASPPGAPVLTDLPPKQGLYDPQFEHDACGVGFVVNVKGRRSHEIIRQGLQVLLNLNHRGACGCEANTGDGAGILIQMPHKFLQKVAEEAGIRLPRPRQYGVGMLFLPPEPDQRRNCERLFEVIVAEETGVMPDDVTVISDACVGRTDEAAAEACAVMDTRGIVIARTSDLLPADN